MSSRVRLTAAGGWFISHWVRRISIIREVLSSVSWWVSAIEPLGLAPLYTADNLRRYHKQLLSDSPRQADVLVDTKLMQSWLKVNTQLCINSVVYQLCINIVSSSHQLCINLVVYQFLINFYEKLIQSWYRVGAKLMQSWYTTSYQLCIDFASTLYQLSCVSTLYQLPWEVDTELIESCCKVDTELIHNFVSTLHPLSIMNIVYQLCYNFVSSLHQLCINSVVHQLSINVYRKLMERRYKVATKKIHNFESTL